MQCMCHVAILFPTVGHGKVHNIIVVAYLFPHSESVLRGRILRRWQLGMGTICFRREERL